MFCYCGVTQFFAIFPRYMPKSLKDLLLKSESEVTQSCPTLSDPMDCSLPGSSIHGIFQARVPEWGAIAFSASWVVIDVTQFFAIFPRYMPESLKDLLLKSSEQLRTFFSVVQWQPLFSKAIPLKELLEQGRKVLQYAYWLEAHGASQVAQWIKNPPAVQETSEMWVPSLSQEDPLEDDMATHSNILAWRIPWTEEPGWLQSMRSQRVGHD